MRFYVFVKAALLIWISLYLFRYKAMFVSSHIKRHTMDRPWSSQFWMKNPAFRTDGELPIVEPIKAENWMWFRGDRVEILTGPDKGKQVIYHRSPLDFSIVINKAEWGRGCDVLTVKDLRVPYPAQF